MALFMDVHSLGEKVTLADVASAHAADLAARIGTACTLPRRPRAAARARPGQLTEREQDVLVLLAEGLSTADIAGRLVVSPRTVEHHVTAVLRKLAAPTRARAVAAARRIGALPTADA